LYLNVFKSQEVGLNF